VDVGDLPSTAEPSQHDRVRSRLVGGEARDAADVGVDLDRLKPVDDSEGDLSGPAVDDPHSGELQPDAVRPQAARQIRLEHPAIRAQRRRSGRVDEAELVEIAGAPRVGAQGVESVEYLKPPVAPR
jgi:hypothetical protein